MAFGRNTQFSQSAGFGNDLARLGIYQQQSLNLCQFVVSQQRPQPLGERAESLKNRCFEPTPMK